MMESKPVYISLGSDCSISFQLRKLGLHHMGSMPLDWFRIDKPETVLSILENDFQDIANLSMYKATNQSEMFNYFDGQNQQSREPINSIKSLIRLKHIRYGFIAPHEYIGTDINIDHFQGKYTRRIERFRKIAHDHDIRKIFVYLDNTKTGNSEINEKFKIALARYGCVNFDLVIVKTSDYNHLIPTDQPFDWRREYINWKSILN